MYWFGLLCIGNYIVKSALIAPSLHAKSILNMLNLRVFLQSPIHITGLSHGCIPMQFHLGPREEQVNLLESKIARFGIKNVNHREETEVKY